MTLVTEVLRGITPLVTTCDNQPAGTTTAVISDMVNHGSTSQLCKFFIADKFKMLCIRCSPTQIMSIGQGD